VAPWRSVYKLNFLLDTEVTFLLTSGGHNAGIVSEPGHAGRHFRVARHAATERYIDPETWYASNLPIEGSWWPMWTEWLEAHSKGKVPAPKLGAPQAGYPLLGPAPGSYVNEA